MVNHLPKDTDGSVTLRKASTASTVGKALQVRTFGHCTKYTLPPASNELCNPYVKYHVALLQMH